MKKKQRAKVNVTIRIDEELASRAKELGLNISKTCEICLKQAVRRLEQLYQLED